MTMATAVAETMCAFFCVIQVLKKQTIRNNSCVCVWVDFAVDNIVCTDRDSNSTMREQLLPASGGARFKFQTQTANIWYANEIRSETNRTYLNALHRLDVLQKSSFAVSIGSNGRVWLLSSSIKSFSMRETWRDSQNSTSFLLLSYS